MTTYRRSSRPPGEVTHQGMTGTVKWFDEDKGYGFIRRDDAGPECFVHYSEIDVMPGELQTLKDNARVQFDVLAGPRGPVAINVTPLKYVRQDA